MSKEEGDEAGLATIEAEGDKLAGDRQGPRVPPHVQPAGRPQQLLPRPAGRRRRHRGLRLGQHADAPVPEVRERKGFKATVEDETPGDTAGIKGATLKIEGDYAFGLLRTETGVHRLVRKSPFDSSGGRHTSFASVFVYPRSTTRSRSTSTRRTCGRTPTAPRAPAASTSTRPIRRCA
jgi:peptide chain release factor 2